MLKIATFPIDKTEDANAFLEKHASRTERGITISPSGQHIVLFYEEGEQSRAELIADLRTELAKKQRERQVSDRQKRTSIAQLRMVIPEGHEGDTEDELLKFFMEHKAMKHARAKAQVAGIANIRNSLLMAVENIFHIDMEIESIREQIKEVEEGREYTPDERDRALIGEKLSKALDSDESEPAPAPAAKKGGKK